MKPIPGLKDFMFNEFTPEELEQYNHKNNAHSFKRSVEAHCKALQSYGHGPDYETLESSWLQQYIRLTPTLYTELTTRTELMAFIANATNQEHIQKAKNKLFLL